MKKEIDQHILIMLIKMRMMIKLLVKELKRIKKIMIKILGKESNFICLFKDL